ncbi:MAG: hypothetical protein LBQ23_02870 [Puniceicoccales bacterium]|jgi:hypothetical protein|nr:hypothetical protein [Puniceicoccales bacterium]
MKVMKILKIAAFTLFLAAFIIPSQGCCSNEIVEGNIFRIKKNQYVPVFNDNSVDLTYKSGPRGKCCYSLDLVLLPLSTIQIIKVEENDNIEIEYCVSKTIRGRGFIHANFIRNSMEQLNGQFWDVALQNRRHPLTLQKFRKACYKCINEKIPYCAGASNLEKINLEGMYSFNKEKGDSLQNKEYELFGFDEIGFLYFVSDGILSRNLDEIINGAVEKLFVFDTKRQYSLEDKKIALNCMRDSDYICVRSRKKRSGGRPWYVLVSFNGGFLEFKGKKHGIAFVDQRSAMKKLDTLLEIARREGSDLYIIRWHPKLIELSRPRDSVLEHKMPLH